MIQPGINPILFALAFIAIMFALGWLSGTSNLVDHSLGAVVEDGRHG